MDLLKARPNRPPKQIKVKALETTAKLASSFLQAMADQEQHHHTITTTGVVPADGCELEKQQPSVLEKLQQRPDSSSSSSSYEEVEGQGREKKKKKKKKGLKEKLKDKTSAGEKLEVEDEDNSIPIEKVEVTVEDATIEEKGFLEKIKAKLPGSHCKKAEDGTAGAADNSGEAEGERKGLLEKLKEKLPGYHKNGEEEKDKEKEKEISANH